MANTKVSRRIPTHSVSRSSDRGFSSPWLTSLVDPLQPTSTKIYPTQCRTSSPSTHSTSPGFGARRGAAKKV